MPQIIAYPGTAGSFTGMAAQQFFPEGNCRGYETFDLAAGAVVNGEADFGLLPVENSFAGSVQASFALLEKLPLHIVAETRKRVRHQLLGVPGATIDGIRTIASHPQAIAQCDVFLSKMPQVQLIPSVNTAISAREVSEKGDPACAAIASLEAAGAFGLQVLAQDIQTSKTNTTRFFVISRDEKPLGKPDKATAVFTIPNRVGSLVQVLLSFAISGLNMSHLESRPLINKPFDYFFIADFEGDMNPERLNAAMDAARPFCQDLRLLGVYPKACLLE